MVKAFSSAWWDIFPKEFQQHSLQMEAGIKQELNPSSELRPGSSG